MGTTRTICEKIFGGGGPVYRGYDEEKLQQLAIIDENPNGGWKKGIANLVGTGLSACGKFLKLNKAFSITGASISGAATLSAMQRNLPNAAKKDGKGLANAYAASATAWDPFCAKPWYEMVCMTRLLVKSGIEVGALALFKWGAEIFGMENSDENAMLAVSASALLLHLNEVRINRKQERPYRLCGEWSGPREGTPEAADNHRTKLLSPV